MNIILTGSNGQLGESIKYIFQKEKYNLLAFNKDKLDITSIKSIRNIVVNYSPDLIINAAAFTAVKEAEIKKDDCYQVNYDGVKNLANICQQLKIPLIHISTDYVFDGSKTNPYDVEDKTNPLNIYGLSKLLGEEEIQKKISKFIIIRTSWTFSEYGSNFVKTITDKIINTKSDIHVVNDQIGGPTSCRLLAKKILLFVKLIEINKQGIWGTYHYSNLPFISWYEFAREIKNILDKLTNNLFQDKKIIPIKTNNSEICRPPNTSLSSKKLNLSLKLKDEEWIDDLKRVLNEIVSI
jgi:dTDP-4-dehydrorhamnose reductase